MLKRVRTKGYKSLRDVEVDLDALTVLVGPNGAGKSNLLDALQLLARLATCQSLSDAFRPPHRGKPLESFAFPSGGMKALREQDSASFLIEVDLELSGEHRLKVELYEDAGDARIKFWWESINDPT